MTDTTTEPSASAGSQAATRATEVVQTTKNEAASVARDAKQHAADLVSQGRDQLRQQAKDQSARVGDTLKDVARQLQGMSEGQAPTGPVQSITAQVAERVQGVADRMSGQGIEGVLDDVKSFARRRPGLFVLSALGAGVVVGRLIRTTDTRAIVDAAKGSPASSGTPSALPPPELSPPSYSLLDEPTRVDPLRPGDLTGVVGS